VLWRSMWLWIRNGNLAAFPALAGSVGRALRPRKRM